MDLATLKAQEEALIFDHFNEETALTLGMRLHAMGADAQLPIVISIRSQQRCLFHLSPFGAAATNDNWARRKSNTVFLFGKSSLRVQFELHERQDTMLVHGLNEQDYALHGGSFPITLRKSGLVGACTVSGLHQHKDHDLVVKALSAQLQV